MRRVYQRIAVALIHHAEDFAGAGDIEVGVAGHLLGKDRIVGVLVQARLELTEILRFVLKDHAVEIAGEIGEDAAPWNLRRGSHLLNITASLLAWPGLA